MYRKQKRIKRTRSIFKSKFFWIFLLCAASSGFAFYGVAFSQFFQIKNIQVQESDPALRSLLYELVAQAVQKNILFFKTQSIFFIDLKGIQSDALDKFPQIEALQIKRSFPSTLVLAPKERQEAALWCFTQNACFAMDEKGIVFEEKKPAGEFTIISSSKNSPPALGGAALNEEMLSPLLDFRARAEKMNVLSDARIAFVSALIVSDLQIRYKTSRGWEIYADPKGNIDWQLTKLQTVLAKETPAGQTKLEYIDLRFGDQAYVKHRIP